MVVIRIVVVCTVVVVSVLTDLVKFYKICVLLATEFNTLVESWFEVVDACIDPLVLASFVIGTLACFFKA